MFEKKGRESVATVTAFSDTFELSAGSISDFHHPFMIIITAHNCKLFPNPTDVRGLVVCFRVRAFAFCVEWLLERGLFRLGKGD